VRFLEEMIGIEEKKLFRKLLQRYGSYIRDVETVDYIPGIKPLFIFHWLAEHKYVMCRKWHIDLNQSQSGFNIYVPKFYDLLEKKWFGGMYFTSAAVVNNKTTFKKILNYLADGNVEEANKLFYKPRRIIRNIFNER